MTARRRPRKGKAKSLWSYSAGEAPYTVCVYERVPGGPLYERIYNPAKKHCDRRSLKHRDQARAIAHAEAEAETLREGMSLLDTDRVPTVGSILGRYLAHASPEKVASSQKDDQRRATLWRTRLGMDTPVNALDSEAWTSFIRARSRGEIDAQGQPVPPRLRTPVRPRTVDADLVFIVSVFNWATQWEVKGRPLLAKNPWGAQPGVKRRVLVRPKTKVPMQPIATYDRYVAIRAVADRVLMTARKEAPGAQLVERRIGCVGRNNREGPIRQWMQPSYLGDILDLVEQTGRRITAVCALHTDRLVWRDGVLVGVRWLPLKRERERVIPIADATRTTILGILKRRRIVHGYLFPSQRRPDRPITRGVAEAWLHEAEILAGVGHLEGGKFHPYRRKWATERKHWPTRDVMEVGGWGDERSLKSSYQQADEETMLAVLNEPRKLVSRSAGG